MSDLLLGLTEYFVYYYTERPHQSLNYNTPDQVYRTARGGGAMILDKYGETAKTHAETENRGSAVPLHVTGYPLKLDALLP